MRRISLAGIGLLGFGLAALLQAARYEFGTTRLPGPGFVPTIAAILLIAAAAGVIVARWRAAMPEAADPVEGRDFIRVAVSIAAIGLFPILLGPLGFLVAAALLFLALFVVGEGRFSMRSGILAATGGLICDGLFRILLKVPLPTGTIWEG